MPVAEGVDKPVDSQTTYFLKCSVFGKNLQKVHTASDERVRGTVLVFVPAVGGSNLLGKTGSFGGILEIIDIVQEFLDGQASGG